MPIESDADVVEAVCELREDEVLAWVGEQLELRPPLEIADALAAGLEQLGARFADGRYFIPELVMGGEIFAKAIELLTPALEASGSVLKKHGTVVMGTVKGDLHDLGQNLVSVTLAAAGFEVINLGCDVAPERFVAEVERTGAQVVGLSALLTTTMQMQAEIVDALAAAGLRDRVRILIGGAVANQRWADEIGADAYGADAIDALDKVKALVGINT
ncbi:MAG: cobalamin-dependent protein [Alphaproteobacteria bacterium]|jgi:5-methyltetrahydrofolate--homocysteine methyltransferase|nr:cobalamin-dependent protein [Alphaproteobacteria bacterium]MDP6873006.1 cobalamin-dependent protein [Alphaproteobacteria bacterium]